MDNMVKPLFVDAAEIARDWGVSKSKAYDIIHQMSDQFLKENPKALIFRGKINRAFYDECIAIKKVQ